MWYNSNLLQYKRKSVYFKNFYAYIIMKEATSLRIILKNNIQLRLRVLSFKKTRRFNHNKNHVAGHSNTSNSSKSHSLCLTYLLFYYIFIFLYTNFLNKCLIRFKSLFFG